MRAEAAPHAAAERDPGLEIHFAFQEPLGPELARALERGGVAVDERDGGRDHPTRGDLVAIEGKRRVEKAGGVDHYRPGTQGLLDDRVDVFLTAAGELVPKARQNVRVPG